MFKLPKRRCGSDSVESGEDSVTFEGKSINYDLLKRS